MYIVVNQFIVGKQNTLKALESADKTRKWMVIYIIAYLSLTGLLLTMKVFIFKQTKSENKLDTL